MIAKRALHLRVLGGGPGGLYAALLAKARFPHWRVELVERNAFGDTFGWGVVFSDATLDGLAVADPESFARIERSFVHWDDIEIHIRGESVRSGGHGFAGISRKHLLAILHERALALGVELRYRERVEDLDAFRADCDIVIAADGVHSPARNRYASLFQPQVTGGLCKFVWLGSDIPLDAFTFFFKRSEHGWFTVHAYRFDETTSTFIVECREETWRAHGLDRADAAATVAFCEALFAEELRGHRLLVNPGHRRGSAWIDFSFVENERWYDGNLVLLGDAAHTAHFSVGSGTKMAMEDAIALVDALEHCDRAEDAFALYEGERKLEVLKLQNAARNSTRWFENVERYARLDPETFAYSLLTRSQRIGHENLRTRDAAYVERIEQRFGEPAIPPMFSPFTLRGLELRNRVVVSPMDTYSAVDGLPNDFHLVHYGSRALGGAGLVVTEMTCVSARGRITPGCTGMYAAEHVAAWKRIVDFVHERSHAKIALQLGHSGPKGSTKLMWEGMDEPLDAENWPVVGPSAIPYAPGSQVPHALDECGMHAILEEFVAATTMAIDAGFDMLELHCAHGYLLSSFLTPLRNQRTDHYGGSLENRLRYPLEVFAAVRARWPTERPISVRISATDWCAEGNEERDAVEIARAFKAVGADLLDVSTGQTDPRSRPRFGRMFQAPFADAIRNEIGIATMAVGNITEHEQVNALIAGGRADLVALGRPHLADPYWTLHAAAELGYRDQAWPIQYLPGKEQLERAITRRMEQGS
ncbi:MAG: bifunctional salicylyl-CoA 5-hydroxylase/oxidoreductase [Candidatus Baltobacteraceae bacterium]